jgi:hypothetical protein
MREFIMKATLAALIAVLFIAACHETSVRINEGGGDGEWGFAEPDIGEPETISVVSENPPTVEGYTP